MDWRNLPRSGGGVQRGGGGGLPGGGLAVGGGIGGLIIALIAMFFGVDPSVVLGGNQAPPAQTQPQTQPGAAGETEEYEFLDRILGSTNEVWSGVFQQAGRTYTKPVLVSYRGSVPTACGQGTSAVGPFYCPLDNKIYMDTAFFNQMDRQLGGGGDFAYSYVIAHEVGHHVQNELGIADQVTRAQQGARTQAEANSYGVRLELQADCFAGVWGNQVADLANLTQEDVREAVNTAAAIGDDTLQRQSQGRVVPDSFTHGSSEQRVNWFMTGFKSGDPNKCDTFSQEYNQL
ncbi:neutral zinc metallopeptidase [Deinococcus sp. MIMF12]|uniref:Neutral zinc metallopeptidase n=1 Tax=Deinococcus rhizophilus TaxID=3049544 RepID=A0ABT7JJT8_9DEIO|nr:neutral zinc metallopeptidase [Deinococcus rhizophilus]MDL2344213.1 neutral zinc metallopeptidase [Deinococcus rhizophilus]